MYEERVTALEKKVDFLEKQCRVLNDIVYLGMKNGFDTLLKLLEEQEGELNEKRD